MNKRITVVIPNYNGQRFLKDCLLALENQTEAEFDVIVVDNGSKDDSLKIIKEFPNVQTICLEKNTGFCGAVNVGIKACNTPYVVLLNNDTKVFPDFLEHLGNSMDRSGRIFSVASKMIMMDNEDLIDDAGDFYCALGWAYGRGKGKPEKNYRKRDKIFASSGGASVYRKEVFEKIGYFDENHFAYLEDIDIGYRAKIYGYTNYFEPKAKVLHYGSGFSGSKYNEFKVNLSSKNSTYIIGKNMPILQILLNLPLLLAGFLIKSLFFAKKGYGKIYVLGLVKGIKLSLSEEGKKNKIPFVWKNLWNYVIIQLELWINVFRRFFA